MQLLCTRDQRYMRQCEAALLAEGIEPRWAYSPEAGASLLDVAASEGERAADLLAYQLAEELRRPRPGPRAEQAPLVLQPAFALAACMALSLIAFYWVTGPFDLGARWFARGALIDDAFARGEWWRMITAATLHSDVGHVLGNASFLTLLGWGAAERLGGGFMLAAAVLTAVAGFGASLVFTEAHVTVGASGALFGLLGVAAGHGARTYRLEVSRRRSLFKIVGAALMLLAFTAFSREANIAAHVGGFVAGAGFGAVAPARPFPRLLQALAGVAAGLVVAGAWALV